MRAGKLTASELALHAQWDETLLRVELAKPRQQDVSCRPSYSEKT
jgi:hypothetical protein